MTVGPLEAAMQEYNFCWLDFQGKPIRTLAFEFFDDVSALEAAAQRCRDNSIDIFQSGRHVARVKKGNAELNSADRTSL